MLGLIDFLPDVDSLLALAPDDLGMILSQLVQQERAPRVSLPCTYAPLAASSTGISRMYLPLYVAEFELHNNRNNEDILGTDLEGY